MKLGILIHSLAGGGAERVVSHLLSYFEDKNIETHLILMNTLIEYDLPENIEIHYIEKVEVFEKGITKVAKIPLLAYKYSRLMKELEITHSLSFLTRASFINIISRTISGNRYKVITNERAYPSLQYGYKDLQSYFNKKMIRTLYKKSDIIICNSQGNADDLIHNFCVPAEKMKIIHNPVDLEKIKGINPITDFFDKNAFNMVTLGRLNVGKNHEMLIKAVAQLNNPIVKLYIFGYGHLKDNLTLLISELKLENQVFLMGFDPEPYKYLKSADLFIFGSNHEGFPNVLLEAMACGLPLLSTNCKAGPSEIMELETEENDLMVTDYGVLVPIKNEDLMAKGIDYFLTNKPYRRTCKANVLMRVAQFKKDRILKKYLDAISELD